MKISVTGQQKDKVKAWFFDYVQSFDSREPDIRENIDLKKEHTLRVCEEILYIGTELKMNQDELRLAEIIALLHDIGRFEQYVIYRTFVDKKSENHAELGIKILKRSGVLDLFDNPGKDIIERSIKYHNMASVPADESEECLFYAKLIRDADKLDIWKVVIDYYNRKDPQRNKAIELGLPDTPGFSDEVYHDLINKKIVDIKHIKNLNDFKLLQTGWIFDINFQPAFTRVMERRYLESIRDVLPASVKIDEIFNVIYSLYKSEIR